MRRAVRGRGLLLLPLPRRCLLLLAAAILAYIRTAHITHTHAQQSISPIRQPTEQGQSWRLRELIPSWLLESFALGGGREPHRSRVTEAAPLPPSFQWHQQQLQQQQQQQQRRTEGEEGEGEEEEEEEEQGVEMEEARITLSPSSLSSLPPSALPPPLTASQSEWVMWLYDHRDEIEWEELVTPLPPKVRKRGGKSAPPKPKSKSKSNPKPKSVRQDLEQQLALARKNIGKPVRVPKDGELIEGSGKSFSSSSSSCGVASPSSISPSTSSRSLLSLAPPPPLGGSSQTYAPVLPVLVLDEHADDPDSGLLDINDDEHVPPPVARHGSEDTSVHSNTQAAASSSSSSSSSPHLPARRNLAQQLHEAWNRSLGLPSPHTLLHPYPYPSNISSVYRGAWSAESKREHETPSWASLFIPALNNMQVPGHLTRPAGFQAEEGILMYMLRAYPTYTPAPPVRGLPRHLRDLVRGESNSAGNRQLPPPSPLPPLTAPFSYVEGELVIRDGHYTSARDLRFQLQGVYGAHDGRLMLFANQGGPGGGGPGEQTPFWLTTENLLPYLAPTSATSSAPASSSPSSPASSSDPDQEESLLLVHQLSQALNRTRHQIEEWQRRKDRERYRQMHGSPERNNRANGEGGQSRKGLVQPQPGEVEEVEEPPAPQEDVPPPTAAQRARQRRRYSDCVLSMVFQVAPLPKNQAAAVASSTPTASTSGHTRIFRPMVAVGARRGEEGSAASPVPLELLLQHHIEQQRDSDPRQVFQLQSVAAGVPDSESDSSSASIAATSSSPSSSSSSSFSSSLPSGPTGRGRGSLALSDARLVEDSGSLKQQEAGVERVQISMSGFVFSNVSCNEMKEDSKQEGGAAAAAAASGACRGCGFRLRVHASVLQIENFFSKAINYAYLCSSIAVLQLYLVLRQMRTTTSSSAASTRVSPYGIALQAWMDCYLSLFHIFTAMSFEPLFNSFVVTAFLEFILFSLFELRFILSLWKVHHPDEFNGGWEQTRRSLRMLYCRFYACLFAGLFLLYQFPSVMPFLMLAAHSIWLPQIIHQAVQGSRRGLRNQYVWSMSVLRLVLPVYFYLCPVNFLSNQTNVLLVVLLIVWMVVQVAVLRMQDKWGARFFVPKRFLPPRYDYFRSVPLLSLSRRSRPSNGSSRPSAAAPILSSSAEPDGGSSDHLYLSIPPPPPAPSSSRPGGESEEEDDENVCPICYVALDPEVGPEALMVTPCDHVFHAPCLRRWMTQKHECPVCRQTLPVEEVDEDEVQMSDLEEQENRT